jgi:hypothetical protein
VSIARQECIKTFEPNHFVCHAFLDFIKISKHSVSVKNAIPGNIQTTRNLPNATNVTVDDTAKEDKHRVFPVHPVHLPHPPKPLNAKSVRTVGFKKEKAKTTVVNRTMEPFRRVVLLR